MLLLISSVLAFITWLILGLSIADPVARLAGGAAVFLAVGGTMLHYVVSCLKRHCRHDHTHEQGPERPRASNHTLSRPV
jgi:hypothetical protein